MRSCLWLWLNCDRFIRLNERQGARSRLRSERFPLDNAHSRSGESDRGYRLAGLKFLVSRFDSLPAHQEIIEVFALDRGDFGN
jgi:hypothetical protein